MRRWATAICQPHWTVQGPGWHIFCTNHPLSAASQCWKGVRFLKSGQAEGQCPAPVISLLLLSGGPPAAQACVKGRWSSNVVVASGMMQLEPVQEAGAVTAAAVQLRLPDKPSVLWGTLLLELAAVRSASTLPGVLGGCPALWVGAEHVLPGVTCSCPP
jgi:hypothetical protein